MMQIVSKFYCNFVFYNYLLDLLFDINNNPDSRNNYADRDRDRQRNNHENENSITDFLNINKRFVKSCNSITKLFSAFINSK